MVDGHAVVIPLADEDQTVNDTPLPALPHYVRAGLRIVFVGFNPGLESARRGHYYAFRGNVFWRQLSESGLVARPVSWEDDHRLMTEAGIGFTDLCARPTARAAELTRDELAEGAARLWGELEAAAPGVAVLCGRGVFAAFAEHALAMRRTVANARPFGAQPERLAGGRTALWVIPNSSGLASGLHRQRLEQLRELAATLRGVPSDP